MKKYITTERADLFEPNITIAMTFRIYGHPSDDALKDAIYTAMQANEVLRSKIVLDEYGLAWYEECSNQANTVTISADDWLSVLRKQEGIRFRFEEGELIRLFILHSDAEIRILILAHHLVGDGKSLVYFIEDIMNALTGKKLMKKEMILLPREVLPKESKMPFFYQMYADRYNRAWERTGKAFSIADYQKIHMAYWKNRQTTVLTERFSKDELNALKQHAKNASVSLTSYMLAAFFQFRERRATAGLAVDGRMDGNRSMSNQATGISIDYRYDQKRSFVQNAKCIQKKMNIKLHSIRRKYFVLHFMGALNYNLVDSVFMHISGGYQNDVTAKITKVLGYRGDTRDISITNLTKLDIPSEYGPYKIDDFLFIPPIISYGKKLTGIATLEDEMTITYHLFDDDTFAKEANYFHKVMEVLKM